MTNKKRRTLITFMSAIPASALLAALPSRAQDAELDPESPEAKNWDYMLASSDGSKNCGNCALYQGDAGVEDGPCAIFPGKSVKAAGLCNAHAPRPN